MQTRLTLLPGQPGTKKLADKYGDRLVCVRYRYDRGRQRRYKTVELIIDEAEWIPPEELVGVLVAWGEIEVARRVKNAGGVWLAGPKVWQLPYRQAVKLGLKARVVILDEEKLPEPAG
ncbi:MAG: hypothetical protein FOGNACKC_02002 [Anaerolineae bacterium]|nr:hypothetical protein [Anaerolineae bacterium]